MQTDWGRGNMSVQILFFAPLGFLTLCLVSCPHTHQQNGTAERKHCRVIEMGLALLA
jgi:hypothetical protein